MLDALGPGYGALVMENLFRRVAATDGALVERPLDLVVRLALPDHERIKKIGVPALPIPDRYGRHVEGGSEVGIGRTELAHLRRHLGKRRNVLAWAPST